MSPSYGRREDWAGFYWRHRKEWPAIEEKYGAQVFNTYTKEEVLERKKKLDACLMEYPDITSNHIRSLGLDVALRRFYGGKINKAREALGVQEFSRKRKEKVLRKRKRRVDSYLKKHPDAKLCDLKSAGLLYDVERIYDSLLKAKRKLGLVEYREDESPEELERMKEEVLEQMKENFDNTLKKRPDLSVEEAISMGYGEVLERFYGCRISQAKAQLDIIDAGWDDKETASLMQYLEKNPDATWQEIVQDVFFRGRARKENAQEAFEEAVHSAAPRVDCAAPESYNPEVCVAKKECVKALIKATEGMRDLDKRVLELRFTEGLTLRQIGKTLGYTRENIRMREWKSIRKLKNFFMNMNIDLLELDPPTLRNWLQRIA